MCQLCGANDGVLYCDECNEELKTKIGIKCLNCGTFGFLEKTELNIQRLEFFVEDFRENLTLYQICVIPMRGCPNCVNKEEMFFGGGGGFTA